MNSIHTNNHWLRRKPRFRLGLCIGTVSLMLLGSVAQAGQLYRYRNADGGVEISSSIPNDRVPKGYEVIDSTSGRLLRTVAPQLTPAQAAAKAEHERRVGVCTIAQRRVQTMYESDEDIDQAETKAMQSLQTRIVNAQANLTHLRSQRAKLEDQAARMERSGKGVSPILVGNLERAQNQIKNLEQEIVQRHSEQQETRDSYLLDRQIFELDDCEQAAKSPLFDLADEQIAENG